MGQSLSSTSQIQSKDELLYQYVCNGNAEAVKTICSHGANLEWIDQDGKTPLIVACMDARLFHVAKALIELGANVNAYRPGRNAGTPLHHAAKRGLDQTVKLLLSSGANALVRNDDCKTALDVARAKRNTSVVRAIETHTCYFSGWIREFYGPGFLEALAPQLMSRQIWAAVIPCGSAGPMRPPRLELAIYPTFQEAEPRIVVSLWKSKIEEPQFQNSDPVLTIVDQAKKTRYRFSSANEGDKQLVHCLYDACRGIRQVAPSHTDRSQNAVAGSFSDISAEALQLATALNASIQSTAEEPPRFPGSGQTPEVPNTNGWENVANEESYNGWGEDVASKHRVWSSSGWMEKVKKDDSNGWDLPTYGQSGNGNRKQTTDDPPIAEISSGLPPVVEISSGLASSSSSLPSAPPMPDDTFDEGTVQYPVVDSTPVHFSVSAVDHHTPPVTTDSKDEGGSSSCIICWEAPVDGACVPCGHMAGCVACLSEIKKKKGDCPVCRAKIAQVIKLYAV